MNLATGSLLCLGFVLLVTGVVSKLMGISLLAPLIETELGYFIAANSCFLMALVIDRFQKE
ncbi:MAG: hypothetical protein A2Z72_06640 [Omnitrophica bacterium RBG_13_46_9]|nr:MAG: hypothetical protein A2Z72_06640 [Omnitrophica bacterium RBG_13_46_9]